MNRRRTDIGATMKEVQNEDDDDRLTAKSGLATPRRSPMKRTMNVLHLFLDKRAMRPPFMVGNDCSSILN